MAPVHELSGRSNDRVSRAGRSTAAALGAAAALLVLLAGCGSAGGQPAGTPVLTPAELNPLAAAARQSAAARRSALAHDGQAGDARVRVPRLVGRSFDAAVRMVHRAGLQQAAHEFTGTLGNPHYRGNCVRISSQAPAPGTSVAAGSTVSITYGVCKGSITRHQLMPGEPSGAGGGRSSAG